MNAIELYLLGRKLTRIAEAALPAVGGGPLPPSVRMVLIDVAEHQASSIGEITERTGFPQSHVSASVARLRELGALGSAPDPADRRRTLVSLAPRLRRGALPRRALPVSQALAAAVTESSPAELEALERSLEALADRLTPRARAPFARSRRRLVGA